MYMDSIHSINGFYALSSFGNVFICDDALTDPKTVTFPNGYNLDSNLSFKVVFVNGHNCSNASTPMELNEIPVVVNKFGTLTPLPIHTITEGGTTYYKSVMPNCVIEMYYTSDYDGNNHPAFVVVGNPVVLSSTDYTIYADGQIGDEPVGTVRSSSLANIPYGWLECNGQAVSRTTYSVLFDKFSTQLYDDPSSVQDPTHTLLSRYGEGDGTNTFNLPDYRECALVGIGSNGTFIIDNTNQAHEVHTLGEFKDDQFQGHSHYSGHQDRGEGGNYNYMKWDGDYNNPTKNIISDGTNGTPRYGTTTHGKQIGVMYLIKVL